MFQQIQEGKAIVKVPIEKKISKDLEVFYNPVMKFNRDTTIAILEALNKKDIQIGLPLSGSGIRGIRILLETKNKIRAIHFNDYDEKAVKNIKNNLKLNKLDKNKNIFIHQDDANLFLLNSSGFDYIEIDPFGTPNPFLDSACKRIARKGILAVTATDTAPLAGTFPKTCKRKYWADPLKNEEMHEIGLRILIRKVQLVAAQYDKALTPIFSFYKDHYFRIYFQCEKGKQKVDKIMKQHGRYKDAGPLWLGQLKDNKIAKIIAKKTNNNQLKLMCTEIDTLGFFDIHVLCKKHKKAIPKFEVLFAKLKIKATRTHFSQYGIKVKIKLSEGKQEVGKTSVEKELLSLIS